MSILTGKKILLIAPYFFGYQNHIRLELAQRGAIVDLLPDRPFSSTLMKAIIRFLPILIAPFSNHFYRQYFYQHSEQDYDYVFVIQGESIGPSVLKSMKSIYLNAYYIFYTWDSVSNKKATLKKLKFFNSIFSFDRNDAAKYGFSYRPLFYINEKKHLTSQESKYLLSFVGTAHSGRYQMIKIIKRSLPKPSQTYFYLYLQAPWVYFFKKLTIPSFWSSSFGDFKFSPLAIESVDEVLDQSFAVLDIEHPNQCGLTMRTFEVLSKGKKLITTNQTIKLESFYSTDNVFIIQRDAKIDFASDFFKTPFRPLPNYFYEKYSLSGWINDIFRIV